ncbi:MAG: hypothetical protein EOS13_05120 [Mesorhizobium sp.]|nr:MAG: hypothetical protein EOS13_05120 [Mesorhizobium sp.]
MPRSHLIKLDHAPDILLPYNKVLVRIDPAGHFYCPTALLPYCPTALLPYCRPIRARAMMTRMISLVPSRIW